MIFCFFTSKIHSEFPSSPNSEIFGSTPLILTVICISYYDNFLYKDQNEIFGHNGSYMPTGSIHAGHDYARGV
ncbi:MAG TPA: hypothetical protein VIP56_00430 [Nitrososphaeraceae archaeon]